ncbi:MAG TPA: hypothetical protein VGJ02_08135 [Pyrinomonadaceae bacterium]
MIEEIEHREFKRCLKISNGDAEVIVSLDFGPRILSYALDGGENILGWHPEAAVQTDLGAWHPYGGHRLWVAPENMPRSYAPDNDKIDYLVETERCALFSQPVDAAGFEKQFRVTLAEKGSGVAIDHKITNASGDARECAAWAITIMRPGGEVIIPNEPFAPYGPEHLLPARSMALWSYTDFTDPRWTFEKDTIRLRVDENIGPQQKLGVLNKVGWAAYESQELRFTKRFVTLDNAAYPDFNCNNEAYVAGNYVEIESLSPLRMLERGESIEYEETWELSSG